MRHVGVREFKANATSWLRSGETLVVERRGTPIGFFVPISERDRDAGRIALDRVDKTVTGILERTGMSEDELVAELTEGL